jgi:hypothetical protein
MAQLLVVVEVFVALGYGVDPLLNKACQAVLDAERITRVIRPPPRSSYQFADQSGGAEVGRHHY